MYSFIADVSMDVPGDLSIQLYSYIETTNVKRRNFSITGSSTAASARFSC